MRDAASLYEQWCSLSKRPEWRRLQRRGLHIRERSDGSYAVVDGYGWGVEFARFATRECAELFIAQGAVMVWHRF
jgi:hypothetical protein